MTVSNPLPSGGDCIASAVEWKAFVEELRRQWRLLWRGRIDDKVKAEGIASTDFELLFVDRGTVIIANKRFKPLNFKRILEHYDAPYEVKVKEDAPSQHVGGWRKFGRRMAALRKEARDERSSLWFEAKRGRKKRGLQLKKGGRGWLHAKVR